MKNVGDPKDAARARLSAICSEAQRREPRKDDGRYTDAAFEVSPVEMVSASRMRF